MTDDPDSPATSTDDRDERRRVSVFHLVRPEDMDDYDSVEELREAGGLPLFTVVTPDRIDFWAVEQDLGATGPYRATLGYTVTDQGCLRINRGQDVLAYYSTIGWLDLQSFGWARASH